MSQEKLLSRRQFLVGSAAAAGGLMISFHIPFMGSAQAQDAATPEVNAWVVVRPDDTVVIRIARSEMGQGTLTGLAQLVAEELECDWARVTTEYPSPGQSLARNRVWGSFSTGGSHGIRDSHEYVRRGGAAARMMLLQAAANEWRVPVAECRVADGVISHAAGHRTTFGSVASAAAKLTPPTEVALKDPKDWKLVGKRLARLDTIAKTRGAQIYGIDVKLPGMLNAAIKACPVFGGKVKSFNAAAIDKRPASKKWCRSATTRWQSLPTPGGAQKARSRRCRSSGTTDPTAASAAPVSRSFCKPDWMPTMRSSATAMATRVPRLQRRRARSRRCIPTRTWPTPRWKP